MTDVQLSRLEPVELRDIWETEHNHFTPWLGGNLDLLGDVLGIRLEKIQQEKPVGPFRADIACRDTSDDSWVLIENQLEATDHVHLGQVLTYAAGLNAATIIWIARRFTDEHRATLDWLNENSTPNIQFFGLEIEVSKIDDSQPAARFNIVSKPNAWTKGPASVTKEPSPFGEFRRHFWSGFLDYVESHASRLSRDEISGGRRSSFLRFPLGRTGFYVQVDILLSASGDGSYEVSELYVGVSVEDRNYPNYSKLCYDQLYERRSEIEAETSETLRWDRKEGLSYSYIGFRPINLRDRQKPRAEQYAWLLQKLEKLHEVFAARVRELTIPESES